MPWLRRLVLRYGLDALIVIAAADTALETVAERSRHLAAGRLWLETVAITGVVLVLILRRRFPFAAPAVMWVASAALSFVDGELIIDRAGVFLAGMGAALALGNLRSQAQARAGLGVVLISAATIAYHEPAHPAADVISLPVFFAISWLVGYALRERADQTRAAQERALRAERDREAAARVAVAEERGRIARELHDVVAHAVSVMVLQVGAVRHRMPESAAADRAALTNAEEAGRAALVEMRRLLSAMRSAGDELELVPSPGLQALEALAAKVRAAGLRVNLLVSGDPVPLPPSVDLSAYRIVQEGLTNALKHAQAQQADVRIRYIGRELQVEVQDDGRGPDAAGMSPASGGRQDPGESAGHGLVGIGERVKLFGGRMSAGAGPGGGFRLWVRLPLDMSS
jgi:signal transduction histidine kinase